MAIGVDPGRSDAVTDPALSRGAGVCEWSVWTTTARLVVTEPALLAPARRLVDSIVTEVDAVASRFRDDSEVRRLAAYGDGRATPVTPLLADLIDVALDAARRTDGDVDPTVGSDLVRLGYDRDLDAVRAGRLVPAARVTARRAASWTSLRLDGRSLTAPAGTLLDLGATAKARTADLAATAVADRLGCGVMVSLGGDLRVAGPEPEGGWLVVVQDGPGEPASTVRLDGARAVATSSTLHRSWRDGTTRLHHILDPARRAPATPVWRTVSVAAGSCVEANVLTTCAVVRGQRAIALLEASGLPARLVAADGVITRVGGWPA